MKRHVMLDLETMSASGDAAITEIGAVAFDSNHILAEFRMHIALQSSIDAGLNTTASTILWWMKQSDAARQRLYNNCDEGSHTLAYALTQFNNWLILAGSAKETMLWGNGASFDNAIISNAYRKARIVPHIPYWNDRCYRTVKAFHPEIKLDRVGIHHSAVDDAKSQALHLIAINKAAGGRYL